MKNELSANELGALLRQKPEIDFRINYYKGVLQSIDSTMKAIDKRLKKGITKEVYWFMFIIPLFRKIVLDDYDKAKLTHERLELDSELYMKKEYYERWLQRSHQYEVEFEKRLNECNEFYDFVHAEAEKAAKDNIRLAMYMGKYKNDDNDTKLKVEYYLYLKQEVQNWYDFSKKKFTLRKLEAQEKNNE